MDIRGKFLELTSKTYPHGKESELRDLLPSYLKEDEFGNLYYEIGDSSTMFTSHLDTASSADTYINHVMDGKFIRTDGKSILGADDKAGVVIMLNMMEHNVPGLYYFFLGEEVGCQGSKKLSAKLKENKIERIQKVISFDRRGYSSVITYQFGSRCCSDEFGNALSSELNKHGFTYKNDPTGLYTDSAQFIKIYPECTNISVGYFSEHTFNEHQDIDHLEKLAQACLHVDWENLPIKRDPTIIEYDYDDYAYGYGRSYYGYNCGSRYTQGNRSTYTGNSYSSFSKPKEDDLEKHYFYDDKFEFLSCMTYNKHTKKIIAAELHEGRIEIEKQLITDLLSLIDLKYEKFDWDGFNLKTKYYQRDETVSDRNDLVDFLPELEYHKYIIEAHKRK